MVPKRDALDKISSIWTRPLLSKEPQETAVILGVSGQDGFFLSKRMIQLGFRVIGVGRRSLSDLPGGVGSHPNYRGIQLDLVSSDRLNSLLEDLRPNYIFNLVGFSHVGASWESHDESRKINADFPEHLVQAMGSRFWQKRPPRLFHASSSEIFGSAVHYPQNEKTPLNPSSPYGIHKAAAHRTVLRAAQAGEINAVCGVLYNHESHLRPVSFISRKLSVAAARIRLGLQDSVEVGSLSQERDWGYAGDHVDAIISATLFGESSVYIIGTGQTHSVRDLARQAFEAVGLKGSDSLLVERDHLRRVQEPTNLVADSSLAYTELKWRPKKTFEQTIRDMALFDLERLRSS